MGVTPKSKEKDKSVQKLLESKLLDTEAEKELDDLTALASQICETPIALISLVDANHQWFQKSNYGLNVQQTPHSASFCAHAVTGTSFFEVKDMLNDERFSDNPLVTADPKVRFYAGVPLETKTGHRLGTLCVFDQKPRTLTQKQQYALQVLANQVIGHFDTKLKLEEFEESTKKLNEYNQELVELQGQLEASLRYARRIQEAMLPNIGEVKDVLSDYFVLSLPKNEVSGDLCWYAQKEEKIIIVVADCTGHGVPGALMSVIGNEMLRQKVHREKNTNPADLLNYLNQNISGLWKKQKNRRLEGMEVAIVTLDLNEKLLQFAGAKRPLFYFNKNGGRHLVRGNRLGIYGNRKDFSFELHETPLEEIDTFYLYTDGFEDQLSDKGNKRISKKVLLNMISEIQILSMAEQKRYLYQFHNFWKGHNVQIDDITFLGVKVSQLNIS